MEQMTFIIQTHGNLFLGQEKSFHLAFNICFTKQRSRNSNIQF